MKRALVILVMASVVCGGLMGCASGSDGSSGSMGSVVAEEENSVRSALIEEEASSEEGADAAEKSGAEAELESETEQAPSLTLEEIQDENASRFFIKNSNDLYRAADSFCGDLSSSIFEPYDDATEIPSIDTSAGEILVSKEGTESYNLFPVEKPVVYGSYEFNDLSAAEEINGIEVDSQGFDSLDKKRAIIEASGVERIGDVYVYSDEPSSIIFGRFEGAKWVEKTTEICERGYLVPDSHYEYGYAYAQPTDTQIVVGVEKTKLGYFVVDLSGVPAGLYAVDYTTGMGHDTFLLEISPGA